MSTVWVNYSELVLFLRTNHYRESPEIVQSGDFLVRGDTVTAWLVSEVFPLRFHYFGEDLEKSEVLRDGTWFKEEYVGKLQPNYLKTEHGDVYPESYVVHPYHGVGIFEYILTRSTEGVIQQYVSLKYAADDKLLFPRLREGELMPYIGGKQPRLTRLYSKSWLRLKEKIQKDLIAIARELLKIYAERQLASRPVYADGREWVKLLAATVEFSLTADQAKAMDEIEYDLCTVPHPMDRLICGDVGFGKTEVALRAATHVLASGKQVAFVAPTTILVEQHYANIQERFATLPVSIGHLSRLTGGKHGDIIDSLENGSTDLIVGTHRLLSKDVKFKDLGLLIVDEEQKFGVAQKERIKELRPTVDVLSLSATPIPRTLSMSLSGLRGLSILRTPPKGRLAVETIIKPYADNLIGQAMKAEYKRGGQMYVVHNRVQSLVAVRGRIEEIAKKQKLTPVHFVPGIIKKDREISVAIAHGQMDEVVLAQTMTCFLRGEIDVLLASSIVEHGLDSPLANTLIVLHSERFGLSDLYQLRGRVGRRERQAYAYFLIGGVEHEIITDEERDTYMTDTAKKRMAALKEADELGSGWSIALRDLEIRGGGNILGHEQHGNMEAVGLLLYAQLLQEEIGRQARAQGISLVQKQMK
jgi:transcription-repair coupling factor (superfamily II helicase)